MNSLSLPLSLSHLSLSPGLAVLQRILDTAAERGWQVTSVNLDVVTEVAFVKLLSDLDYKREFQIIIDCELERLNYILNVVKKYNQSIVFLTLLAPCRVITGTNSAAVVRSGVISRCPRL